MKTDLRLRGLIVTVVAIVVLGTIITLLPGEGPIPEAQVQDATSVPAPADPRLDPGAHEREARSKEIDLRFKQAVTMLHAKQYDYAIKALHRVLELSPRMPEAHTNMGYALIGLEQYKAAADFFDTAITLNPQQLNAYYGLALAYEGQNNYLLALSAMESFLHLIDGKDPYQSKAQAAVWEWREKIKDKESSEGATAVSAKDGDAHVTATKQP